MYCLRYKTIMPGENAAFYVGRVPIHGRMILAPMDGFGDSPFRLICRKFGSAMSYIPFISARAILQDSKRLRNELHFDPGERPIALQLYDDDPVRLHKAALRLLSLKPDIIDINMGCSNRRVSGHGAGAGLLRDTHKIAALIEDLSASLPVPVTVKIRLGWNDLNRNYLEVAKIVEENNGAMLAVHGRTRQQAYKGKADWDAIAEIKQAVSIPVIGNGDVGSPEDVRCFFAHTACDGVMIGRAAIGNPWIFQERHDHKVSLSELSAVIYAHYEGMRIKYGERLGLLRFRKHLCSYLAHAPRVDKLRYALLTADDHKTFLKLLARAGFSRPSEPLLLFGSQQPSQAY
jgi:nifR3 family TIM-barrel protein